MRNNHNGHGGMICPRSLDRSPLEWVLEFCEKIQCLTFAEENTAAKRIF